MYIGAGIFLLVVGAILKFAVADKVSGVDLGLIGLICMGGGVLAILLSLVQGAGRKPGGYSATRTEHVDPNTGSRVERTDVDPT